MPGPVGKHSSARARRNKVSTGAQLIADPTIEVPPLPPAIAWCEQTSQWWADVWASPMAPEYDDSDKHGLFMLAALVFDFWQAEDYKTRKELAAEIRLQRNRFGLSPMDRRSLQWQIEAAEGAMTRGAAREKPLATNAVPKVDPRAVLHAV